MRSMRCTLSALLAVAALHTSTLSTSRAEAAEPEAAAPEAAAPEPATSAEERRAQARAHFESGLAHFDRGEWSAALADFMRSREIFSTRSATRNASVCLRREARYDEALDMAEDLLRSFPELPADDRAFAEREIVEPRAMVGSIELTDAEPGPRS